MPAGRPHQARSADDWSLHISITAWPVEPAAVLGNCFERIVADLPATDLYPAWDGSFGDQSDLDRAAKIASNAIAEAHHNWRLTTSDTHRHHDRLAEILGLTETSA
ncbi:hypothetical protein [Micromonospora sp. NPDC093277]|uniref:hypothetical protein n=1 Tax=Micromonospora sp. NPDC093277 TaxID=3364291 RepID=UPI00382D500E